VQGCTCGQQIYSSPELCTSCYQSRQHRTVQHKYMLPDQTPRQLTPPPTKSATARSPRDRTVTVARSAASKTSPASEAITSAFAADSGTSPALFPPTMYRYPTPQPTRRSDSIASSRSDSATLSTTAGPDMYTSASELPGRKGSRSATPDPLRAGYAPMAAGFARLGRQDAAIQQAHRQARPSLDLEARMFSGPA